MLVYMVGNPEWDEAHTLAALYDATDPWLSAGVQRRLRAWFENCTSHHSICGKSRLSNKSDPFYPSRLISVGADGENIVRLIDTAETVPTGAYMTLSHRWPTDASSYTQLKHNNLELLENQIETASLSKVFQNAISCTRSLGIKYIWIDSLCIMQDSKVDWQVESAMMADVYAQSYCNISATADECKEGGLFHTRRGMPRSHERVTSNWTGQPFARYQDGEQADACVSINMEDYIIYDEDFWSRRVDQQELYSRGWVFQEQQLASRIIHFSPDQLLWECHEHRASEKYPLKLPQKEMTWGESWLDTTATVLKRSLVDGGLSRSDQVMGMSPWEQWQEVIRFYSGLHLTSGQDKLAAIAGVARTYYRLYSGRYLAGHWAEDLIYSLHWRLSNEFHTHRCPLAKVQRPEAFRQPNYIAPSWSWASVDGAVRGYGEEFSPKYVAEIVQMAVTLLERTNLGLLKPATLYFEDYYIPRFSET